MKTAKPWRQRVCLTDQILSTLSLPEMEPLIQLINEYRNASSLERSLEVGDKIASAIRPRLARYIGERISINLVPDLVQQTLMGVIKNLFQFNGDTDSTFWSWCYVIARRRIADVLRDKENTNVKLFDHEELMRMLDKSSDDSPMTAQERADFKTILAFIESMEGPCKNYLNSHFILAMDWQAIGEEYGMSPNAVRMAIGRCIQVIRNYLGE